MPKYELEENNHGEVDPIDKLADQFENDADTQPENDTEENADQTADDDAKSEEQEPSEGSEGEDLNTIIPDVVDSGEPPFDLGNGVSLKVGDKVTPQHLDVLSRGHMMQSEFTKKCQEVAQIRQEAEQAINSFNQVVSNEVSNPALLFQHVTPQHAIRALAAIGYDVDPRVLNEMGRGSSYQGKQQHVQGQGNGYNQLDPSLARGLQSFQAWQEQQKQEQLTKSIDAEVRAQIQDVKNDKIQKQMYKEILVELAINQDKPISMIAREVRQSIKDRYSNLFASKKQARIGSQTSRTSGSSRPLSAALPSTFDEAERSARGRLGI
jgi:hypothetical protein